MVEPVEEPQPQRRCEHGLTVPHVDESWLAGKRVECPGPCICTNFCPETDNECPYCRSQLDCYDPCPVIGFGCGTGSRDTAPTCDCCTPEQWDAARQNESIRHV